MQPAHSCSILAPLVEAAFVSRRVVLAFGQVGRCGNGGGGAAGVTGLGGCGGGWLGRCTNEVGVGACL